VAVLIVTSALLVNGCSSMSNKEIGSVVGVVVGTTVGIGIGVLTGGKSGGEAAAVVGGIVGLGVGGMLGAFIGEQLDEAERLKAENAALKAANDETAIPVAWKSDTRPDVHGHATVLSTYAKPLDNANSSIPVQPAQPENAANPNFEVKQASVSIAKTCKSVREVYYIGNDEHNETVQYCKPGSSSSWTKVTA
jgi:surface antigen